MAKARNLGGGRAKGGVVTFSVFAMGDPRIDKQSRLRVANIIKMVAQIVERGVKMPDGGVDAIICAPDTWAFPQLTLISLLSQLSPDVPVNITCGNSGPKPGVVYAHAVNSALAQSGRLVALNVGNWADTGMKPVMSKATVDALIDWCYAALTRAGLKGR